jgi:hypothetical protein
MGTPPGSRRVRSALDFAASQPAVVGCCGITAFRRRAEAGLAESALGTAVGCSAGFFADGALAAFDSVRSARRSGLDRRRVMHVRIDIGENDP